MAQDGLAAFEPAFVDELAVMLAWALAYIQKDGERPSLTERTWLRDETGGSVYLRLSTAADRADRARTMTPALRQDIIDGGYWLRKPGPNCQVVVAYTGAVAPEAIEAVGLMAEDRRDVGLLAVTSADRLNAGWTAAQRARERGLVACALAHRAAARRRAAALRHRHRDRRPSRDARLARRRRTAIACARSASSISARPERSPTSTATTASMRTRSSPRPRRIAPGRPIRHLRALG